MSYLELNDYEFDEVIINLKVLGALNVNEKLYTSGTILNIEQISFVPLRIKRFLRGDNRDEAIKKIDRVITKSALLLQQEPGTQDRTKTLVTVLKQSGLGLENFRETYSSCVQTKARIDNLLLKIKLILEKHPLSL